MDPIKSRLFSANYSWKSLFEASFFASFVYVFLEWLFIVTKPSFFSAVSLGQKIRIFLFTESLLSIAVFLVMLGLFAISRLARQTKLEKLLLNFGAVILAVIAGSLGLLLVDNFTYTVFKFGIITSQGFTAVLYLAGYLGLIYYFFLTIKRDLASFDRWAARWSGRKYLDLAIIVLVLASFLLNYERPETDDREFAGLSQNQSGNLPNIILITADGLNAANTSAYGYERDTTPRIKQLAQDALVAENVFNNSGSTMGSLISIYTGRYPTQTRTLYAPDILKGQDAYQHFPNILKRLGYYNIQYTHPHHADAYARNLLSGFDEANGKSMRQSLFQVELNKRLKTDYAYFIYETANRLIDRLRHISLNKAMVNQQDLVEGKTQRFNDQEKLDQVMNVIENSNQPVFAHIHWMGTHGATFVPAHRTYSANKDIEHQEPWDVDFYDDSIHDFDDGVGQIIDRLEKLGIYDNTILIVGSDHSQNYYTYKRIPLIMHFPGGQHQQSIRANVQNLDIAPTLLDFLQVEKPAWMQGRSLLAGDPGDRPVLAVGVGSKIKVESMNVVLQDLKPPFYQFGYISVVYCNAWYQLDLIDYHWEQGTVTGHTAGCANGAESADETALKWMRERLAQDGFDTSLLTDDLILDKSGQ